MSFRSPLQRVGLALSVATLAGSAAAPAMAQVLSAEFTLAQASPAAKPAASPAPSPAASPAPAARPQAAPNREAPFSPAAAPSAAAEPQLYERASFINTCRSSGSQPITVSANVTRTTYTETIPPFTRINLTGVVAYNSSGQVQYVQINKPAVGYVPTATLQTNCDAGSGSNPPPSGNGTCYTIRPAVAPKGLAAFESPGGAAQLYPSRGGSQDGPASGSQVFLTNPATPSQNFSNRTFVKVRYKSLSGSERIGWISQGPVGSVAGAVSSNFAPCP